MSPLVATIIGLIGSALMVIAYAYSNLARELNFTLFNLLNLLGSILLIVSLCVAFNLASMLLEIAWGLIALVGLVRSLAKRKAR